MNMKTMALIACVIAGLVWRDAAIAISATVGVGTLIAWILSLFWRPIAPLGGLFWFKGFFFLVAFVVLASIHLPGDPGALEWMPLETLPPWQAWALDHRWQCGFAGALLGIGILSAMTAVTKRFGIVGRYTHPKVAAALIRQQRFVGYQVRDGHQLLRQDHDGRNVSSPITAAPSPPVQPKPVPTVPDAAGRRQPLPAKWIDVQVPAHLSLDDVLGTLVEAGLTDLEPMPPTAIRVKAADALRVQGIVAEMNRQPVATP